MSETGRRRVGRPSKADRMKSLEEKFNLAETLVEELDDLIEDVGESMETASDDNLPMVPEHAGLMNIEGLKQDFMLARNNIIKLITTGQRILDQASVLNVSDLKASQLEALATLQSTLGANLKLLLEIYKDIAAIEKSRGNPTPSNVNNGSVTTNNIVYAGSSSDLLKILNEQQQPVRIN